MKNFRRDFHSDDNRGGSRFGGQSRGRSYGGNRDRDERPTMHRAVCDGCGKSCEVPFKPTGNKPVYCETCFQHNDGPKKYGDRNERSGGRDRDFGGRGRDSGRDRDRGRSFQPDKEMFEAVCDSCGEMCKVPFQPRGDKAVFCDKCFSASRPLGGGPAQSDNALNARLDEINAKLDKIIQSLFPLVPMKKIREQRYAKEAEKEAKAKAETPEIIFDFEEEKPKKAVKKTTVKKASKKVAVKKAVSKKVSAKKPATSKSSSKKSAKKA